MSNLRVEELEPRLLLSTIHALPPWSPALEFGASQAAACAPGEGVAGHTSPNAPNLTVRDTAESYSFHEEIRCDSASREINSTVWWESSPRVTPAAHAESRPAAPESAPTSSGPLTVPTAQVVNVVRPVEAMSADVAGIQPDVQALFAAQPPRIQPAPGGSGTTWVEVATERGSNFRFPDGDRAPPAQVPEGAPNEQRPAVPAPRVSGLLSELPLPDLPALGRDMEQFLNELGQAQHLSREPEAVGLWSWVLAGVAVAAACEIARRQVLRPATASRAGSLSAQCRGGSRLQTRSLQNGGAALTTQTPRAARLTALAQAGALNSFQQQQLAALVQQQNLQLLAQLQSGALTAWQQQQLARLLAQQTALLASLQRGTSSSPGTAASPSAGR